MFMGFILHIYIIFWTNLLTEGPTHIAVFFLFQCFAGKEYQTESKWNETFGSDLFGTNTIQETWSGRQGSNEAATRQEGMPRGVGCAPTLVDGGWPPSGAFFAQHFKYIPNPTFMEFHDFWSCAE